MSQVTGIRAKTEQYLREHPEIEPRPGSFGARGRKGTCCCIMGAALLAHGKAYFERIFLVDPDLAIYSERLVEAGTGAACSPSAAGVALGIDGQRAHLITAAFDKDANPCGQRLLDFTYLLPE